MKLNELVRGAFKKRKATDYILYLSIIFGGIGLDQLTKWLAVEYLKPVRDVPLWDGVLHLHYATNDGAAFGMLDNARWVFITFSVLAIVALSLYLFLGHAQGRLYEISIAMIIAGGIGNMIDRIALGEVIDFIYFKLINFAIFNGADSFVCVGAGLLVVALVREIIAEGRAEKERRERSISESAHKEDGEE